MSIWYIASLHKTSDIQKCSLKIVTISIPARVKNIFDLNIALECVVGEWPVFLRYRIRCVEKLVIVQQG